MKLLIVTVLVAAHAVAGLTANSGASLDLGVARISGDICHNGACVSSTEVEKELASLPQDQCSFSYCRAGKVSCCAGACQIQWAGYGACVTSEVVSEVDTKTSGIDIAGKCPHCNPGHVCVEGSCQSVDAVEKALAALLKDQCSRESCHINKVGCCAGYSCEIQWAGYGACVPSDPTPTATVPVPTTNEPTPCRSIDLAGKCPHCKPGHVCLEGSCQSVKTLEKALAELPQEQCSYNGCHIGKVACCTGYWCEVQWAGYGACIPDHSDEPTPTTSEPAPTESPSQCSTRGCHIGHVECCSGYFCEVQWAGYGACISDVPTPSTAVPVDNSNAAGECPSCNDGHVCLEGSCKSVDVMEKALSVVPKDQCSYHGCHEHTVACCEGYYCELQWAGYGACIPDTPTPPPTTSEAPEPPPEPTHCGLDKQYCYIDDDCCPGLYCHLTVWDGGHCSTKPVTPIPGDV